MIIDSNRKQKGSQAALSAHPGMQRGASEFPGRDEAMNTRIQAKIHQEHPERHTDEVKVFH